LKFVPVIASRELEGKVAKGGVGFGGDSEIYLLERMLRVGAAMVTSELK
jgi:isocitrate lyase